MATKSVSAATMMQLVHLQRSRKEKIGLKIHTTPRKITVISMVPDSPSARSGAIEVGDNIIEIEGKSTYGMTSSQVQAALAKCGTTCRLRVYRPVVKITASNAELTPSTLKHVKNIPSKRINRRLWQDDTPDDASILMRPINQADIDTDDTDFEPLGDTHRSTPSPILLDHPSGEVELREFEQLEREMAASAPTLVHDSKNIKGPKNQPDLDNHESTFAHLQHLAKTDYQTYRSQVLNEDVKENGGTCTDVSTAVGTELYSLDAMNIISQWLRSHTVTSDGRCAACVHTLTTSRSPSRGNAGPAVPSRSKRATTPVSRTSGIPTRVTSGRARSNSIVSVDSSATDDFDDDGASFQVFKYKVLLTQLEAARSRRADTMDKLEQTKTTTAALFSRLFGSQCMRALEDLIPQPVILSDSYSLMDAEQGPSFIPVAVDPARPITMSKRRTADMLCKAVVRQQRIIDIKRGIATQALEELHLQQMKAIVAARGVKARVIRLWGRGSASQLGLSLVFGICGRAGGAVIRSISSASPAARSDAIYKGDVIIKINDLPALELSKAEIEQILSSTSGYTTLTVAPIDELDAAIALRWFPTGGNGIGENCGPDLCRHELAVNRWLYQCRSVLRRHELEELELPWAVSKRKNTANHRSDTVFSIPNSTSAKKLAPTPLRRADLEMSLPDLEDDLDAASDATTSDVGSSLERMLSSIAASSSPETLGVVLAKSNSHELDSLLTEVSAPLQIEQIESMVDALVSSGVHDCEATPARYEWQIGANAHAKMERRRLELLELDISGNDVLMNEWMMLLRVRATVEHVQKFHGDLAEPQSTTPRSGSPSVNQPMRRKRSSSMRSRFSAMISNALKQTKRNTSPQTPGSPSIEQRSNLDTIITSTTPEYSPVPVINNGPILNHRASPQLTDAKAAAARSDRAIAARKMLLKKKSAMLQASKINSTGNVAVQASSTPKRSEKADTTRDRMVSEFSARAVKMRELSKNLRTPPVSLEATGFHF